MIGSLGTIGLAISAAWMLSGCMTAEEQASWSNAFLAAASQQYYQDPVTGLYHSTASPAGQYMYQQELKRQQDHNRLSQNSGTGTNVTRKCGVKQTPYGAGYMCNCAGEVVRTDPTVPMAVC